MLGKEGKVVGGVVEQDLKLSATTSSQKARKSYRDDGGLREMDRCDKDAGEGGEAGGRCGRAGFEALRDREVAASSQIMLRRRGKLEESFRKVEEC
ncbi:hypothetical protein HYFRA_00004968 [Hymenoscyphus fraxineus]|uniref:Uncharacterized protein n=1 Tax=Hymenoscyphus fraxineus TaxID=746836 RepID=A0A9N9PPD8_9HELO|nr:hypothetical protein HYFRA_00004968 [Hymenoscyphus fraxineus]